ncbi:MAG: chemotaxis protein CheA [Candidatus Cloacimonetes bacterium]|nr:chemotaxis protein CheA [Candidatus Cloacimonadota bacterium]
MSKQEFLEFIEFFSVNLIDIDEAEKEEIDSLMNSFSDKVSTIFQILNQESLKLYDSIIKSFLELRDSTFKKPDLLKTISESFERFKRKIEEITEDKFYLETDNSAISGENQICLKSDYPEKIIDEDRDILHDYQQEMSEYTEELEQKLIELEKTPDNNDLINHCFRLFHSLKGNSGVMSHHSLHKLAHATEDIFDAARSKELTLNDELFKLIFASLDMIKQMLSRLNSESHDFEPADKSKFENHLELVTRFKDLLDQETEKQQEITTTDENNLFQLASEADVFVQDDVLSSTIKKEATTPVESRTLDFVRISTKKLDFLIDMLGELIISMNAVKQDELVNDKKNINFAKKVSQLSRVVTDLQQASISLRMVQISGTLHKIKRLVRDYLKTTTKKINLKVEGEETEIDRSMADLLYEPLSHIIRNACDHGIEEIQERISLNKPDTGTIILRAYHKGNSFLIDIIDDGRGIDSEKILEMVKQKGLLNDNEQISEHQINQFIFVSGITTAASITNISGRGIGMDVVKQTIHNMGGTVEIESKKNQGSTFRIKLPLTLGIIEGMLVRINFRIFIIPIINVVRAFRPQKESINKALNTIETVKTEGFILPVIRLDRILGIEKRKSEITDAIMVMINCKQGQYALVVDELVGIQDVVIKTLGDKFDSLKCISGATILGDGSMGLILDVNNL